jgi:hypothetical protein
MLGAMPPGPTPPTHVRPGQRAALLAGLIGLPVAVAFACGAVLLAPHRDGGFEFFRFLAVLAAGVPAHELVHAAAFAVAGVPLRAIGFGFNRRRLYLYCRCRAVVQLRTYRFALLAPFAATIAGGGVALALLPRFDLALAVGTLLAGCAGDLLMVSCLRPFAAGSRVRDHPTELGCTVSG